MYTKKYLPTSFIVALFIYLNISYLGATDGYFSLGYGARHKGVAGAGISLYHFSLANGNPAGHVFLDNQFEIGLSFFNPNREFTVTGSPSMIPGFFGLAPGTEVSGSKLFFIPRFAGNWHLDENSAFSVSVFGHGGMNTDYPSKVFFDQGEETTGVNLSQLLTNLTYSRKLSANHSIGFSAVVAFQLFELKGASNFAPFSSDGANISNNGTSTSLGFGFKVGYIGQFTEALSFGATFQSKTNMSEFDEYKGLFAEQGDFDIPSSLTAGISYALSNKFTAMFDVKQIYYSKVRSIGNPMDLQTNGPVDQMGNPNPNFKPLGDDAGWGFGWEDMTVYKFGFEYDASENWMFRGGFSHGNNPVTGSEVLFNILAPGIIKEHIAVGLSKKLVNNRRIDFSFNYALSSTVSGFNPLDFDPVQLQQGQFVPNQTIELKMNQIDIEIGYTF